jgi:hypothetical protein
MLIGLAAMLLALGGALPSQAAFHLFRIDQVYSSADSTVQYVVITEATGSNGENFWAGNRLETTSTGGAKQQFMFPANLPSSDTASRHVLIGTTSFAALHLVTPDYTVPDGFIPRGGGKLDYASGTDEVTFGALPTDGATAFNRNNQPVAATPTNFAGASATLTATAPPPTLPDLNQHGLTGSWFEQATDGQGIELEVFPNLVAAGTSLVQGAWFTFEGAPAGGADRERWFTFNGNGQSGAASVSVTIFRNVGGNFDAAPITQPTIVGTGTLSFADCSNATLAYTFTDGSARTGSIALTRLAPNVTCTVGTAPPTNADYALSGNWFDAMTSGQGVVVDVNPVLPAVFLTWYTYAPAGQALGVAGQRWFTAVASYIVGARTMTLPLSETTGGVFDQSPPKPMSVSVGTATLTFASCTSAQLNFNFTSGSSAGKSGTIALGRVGPVPPGCVSAAAADPMPMPPPAMCYYGDMCPPGG